MNKVNRQVNDAAQGSYAAADQTDDKLGRVGLKLFFYLAQAWGLKQTQQLTLLGLSSRTTLKNYRDKVAAGENVKLPLDLLERLSLLAGIRKAIEILYPKPRWDDYINSPNAAFSGYSPLEWMLQGRVAHLIDVRRYLDAQRGTHFG